MKYINYCKACGVDLDKQETIYLHCEDYKKYKKNICYSCYCGKLMDYMESESEEENNLEDYRDYDSLEICS